MYGCADTKKINAVPTSTNVLPRTHLGVVAERSQRRDDVRLEAADGDAADDVRHEDERDVVELEGEDEHRDDEHGDHHAPHGDVDAVARAHTREEKVVQKATGNKERGVTRGRRRSTARHDRWCVDTYASNGCAAIGMGAGYGCPRTRADESIFPVWIRPASRHTV